MKKIYLLIAALVTTSLCSYGSIAFDDSSDSAYADNWQGSDNGGYGFNPWTIASSGSAGIYINSDTPGEKGFRTWANWGSNVTATRLFNDSLNAGETFSLNLGHWGGNSGEVGISLLSGASTVYNVKLTAGASSWAAWDGGNYDLDGGIGDGMADYHTTDDDNALFSFTYHGGNSYGVSLVDSLDNGYVLATHNAGNDISAITGVVIYNNNQDSGGNFYVDNLQIIPEPATIGLFGIVATAGAFIRRRFVA